MNSLLVSLYDRFYTSQVNADMTAEAESFRNTLMESLDKPERKLVLRLIDAKDRISEERSIDSFISGFNLACRLAYELHQYNEDSSKGDMTI